LPIGAILFVVLAYTVLMLAVEHLPPNYAAGAAFLAPLIGFAAGAQAAIRRMDPGDARHHRQPAADARHLPRHDGARRAHRKRQRARVRTEVERLLFG
jgi:hypothetical protein